MVSPTQFRSVSSLSSERILTLPPAHDRTSLSSFGGEGWGEEAALSESPCRPGLQTRRCPSPQPSPRARLAGRGRNLWWQCQDAPPVASPKSSRFAQSFAYSNLVLSFDWHSSINDPNGKPL